MRPGQQNKRGRGRNNNNGNNNNNNFNRKGANPLTRTYDSSGPDVKIRGTAQHIAEKYAALARDAQSSGDRVIAENYLQHAEHYNRIIASAQAQMQERFQRDDRSFDTNEDDEDDDRNEGASQAGNMGKQPAAEEQRRAAVVDGSGPQPVIEGVPAEVAAEEDEAGAVAAGDKQERSQNRRRSGANRSRRTPRRSGEAEGEGGEASAQQSSEPSEGPAPAVVEAVSD